MKRLLLIFFMFITLFQVKSQTITNSNIQGIDCNNTTGFLSVTTDIPASWFIFKRYDDVTMTYITIQTGVSDSVVLNNCGDILVEVLNSSFMISDQDTFFVDCPLGVTPSGHQNVECFGDSTGALKGIAYGGVVPYTYNWYQSGNIYSSGIDDTIITNLFVSQYKLVVTDGSGCEDSVVSNISQPTLLMVDSLLSNSVHCKGTNTGSLQFFITGGRLVDSLYLYNYYLTNTNNDTIRFFDVNGTSSNVLSDTVINSILFDSLGVGNYTIHVVDSFGCSLDSVVYVSEPDFYSLHVSLNPSIVCEQDSTWLNIDSVSGGHDNLEYNWLDFIPGDSIYVNAGIYTAVIFDLDYGCKDSLDYNLVAPNTIFCDVSSEIAPCYGTNTGSLMVDSIYGGVAPYTVQWGGVNTDSLYAGMYTLFITDSLGCIYMEDHEVFENPDVNLNETLYLPLCNGDANGSIAINISGGTAPLTYLWTNASGTPDSVYSLSVGTYYVETSDSLGCNFIDSVVLTQSDILDVNFSGVTNPLICNGGQTLINANITGGTGLYSINWMDNLGVSFSTDLQVVISSGSYTINISDENGCPATNSIIITEPIPLSINGSFVPATCNVGGSANITHSGGTEPVTYVWSNGGITSSVSDLEGGDHWVLVTDSCGDTATYSFTINEYILETSIYYDAAIREAIVEVDNSTTGSPFSYQWYDENMNAITGETNNLLDDLCEDWYFVTTKDGNNCEVTDSVEAVFFLPLGGVVDETTTTVYDNNDLWGGEPYTYLWDNGDVTAHGNVCPGFHRVWVTDVNGCEVVGEITIDEINLSLSPSDVIIECDITNLDVELEVIATGGTGQFTYLWSSGETENPINLLLNPGVYSVEVMDENFCKEDTVFHIAAMSADCVPNVFSPNDDGINDVWSLEDAFFYPDSEVRVYGRYGNLIFKSVGYTTPWDGKNKSGNDVEEGAYFYVIDLGNDTEKIKGTVSVIR